MIYNISFGEDHQVFFISANYVFYAKCCFAYDGIVSKTTTDFSTNAPDRFEKS